MDLNFNKYITERAEELTSLLDNEANLLVTAPTDSGKTFFIIDYAQKSNKRIAFLMPTQNLVKNIEENYKHIKELNCGYGHDFAYHNQLKRFICTTYDSFDFFTYDFDIVIIDEAHFLAGHGNFRTEVLAKLLSIKSKVILLTGTPEIIETLPNFTKVILSRSKQSKKYATIIESYVKAKRNAFDIIEKRNKSNLLIVRINNKNTIDEIFDAYKKELNIVKLYSDHESIQLCEQEEKTLNSVKKGVIPNDVDVLLCTSILDAGISLTVSKDVDCFAISENGIPNAIDVIQLFARVRTSSKFSMNLTVLGQFGKRVLPEGYTLQGSDMHVLVQIMNVYYKTYSELDEENYLNILGHYNIIVESGKQKVESISKVAYLSRINPSTIVSNLHNFPELFKSLENKVMGMDYSWVEYFRGETIINSTVNSTVMRIYLNVAFATEKGIHPELYLENGYQERKLKNLIYAIDEFNHSMQFRKVLLGFISEVEKSEGTKIKLCLDCFHKLSEPQRDAIKTISALLFNGRQWKRKNITLTRKPYDNRIESYLENFNWVIKLSMTG